jgi:hypothetical protein
MGVHDVQVAPMLFRCIKDGTWNELVIPVKGESVVEGGIVTFREFNDDAARYTNAEPLTFRIVKVASRFADLSRIPFGCVLIQFEKIAPAHNPPVIQYTPIPKDRRLPAAPRPPTRWPLR